MLRHRTTMIHRRLMFEHIVFERDEIAESSPFRWSSPCPDPNPAPTSCFVEAPKPSDRPRKGTVVPGGTKISSRGRRHGPGS